MTFIKSSITKLFLALLIALGSSSYTVIENAPEVEDLNKLVTLNSSYFEEFAKNIANSLIYNDFDTIEKSLLADALRGFFYLKETEQIQNDSLITIIDYKKHSAKKRLWVINIESKKVLFNELVAHGQGSGEDRAVRFSNKYESHQSSLGFYKTGDIYYGSNGLSLKLHGLEPFFNSNAFTRGIVIHGANYVSRELITTQNKIGRSHGCPAVRTEVNKQLIHTIQGGTCLFAYFPNKEYLEKSKIFNANLYLPLFKLV